MDCLTRNQMRACVLSWCARYCRQVSVEAQSLQGLSEDQKLGLPFPMVLDQTYPDNCPRAAHGACFLARGPTRAFSARLWLPEVLETEAQRRTSGLVRYGMVNINK